MIKILYIVRTLALDGGVERIITEKMNYLANHLGYDVSVITCFQINESQKNTFYLSEKVKQINLQIPFHTQYKYKYPKRLWIKWELNKQLKKTIQQTIQQINPDIIITLSYFYADFICSIPCHAVKIIESHEARDYTLSTRNPTVKHSLLKFFYLNLYRLIYLRRTERLADVIVTLTKGDAKLWKNARRVEIIPNFSTMKTLGASTLREKRVVAVGRLAWQKGFDRLVKAWTIVNKKHPDWQLAIFGSGPMEDDLRKQIHQANLQNVEIHPFTHDISQEYYNSSIYALSSHYEGLPLVLIEAMRHGLPCVAFNCKFGASDVIINNQCGFIVDDGDIDTFAIRICQLIESDELRKRISIGALERSKSFDVERVMETWNSLFKELCRNRKQN